MKQGHEVTLFASGDSITSAKLVPCTRTALRLDSKVRDSIPYYMLMLDRVRQQAAEFDILHFHIDFFPFPLFRSIANRTVTTLHGRQDLPDLLPYYLGFGDMPLVSISDAQRRPITDANFAATIYHGIPTDLHKPTLNPRGGYVAFLGRISPEKGPERAIAIARSLGLPLKMAAKVDAVDEQYFHEVVEPLLGPGVEFIGEINERQKTDISRRSPGVAVPDRLAGAVRADNDRSDGMRNARARLPARLGPRNHRSWCDRNRGRRHGRGCRRLAAGSGARPAKGAGTFRATFFRHAYGKGLCEALSFDVEPGAHRRARGPSGRFHAQISGTLCLKKCRL